MELETWSLFAAERLVCTLLGVIVIVGVNGLCCMVQAVLVLFFWLVKVCGPVMLVSLLLLGSAMVAMYVTPPWCSEELFVVKLSDVLIMMV